VQADDWRSDTFLPDGPNPTIDASQLLAARGIAVLDYSDTGISYLHGVRRAQSRMEAAVTALVDAGIVDPSHVAQTGFSGRGYDVYYAVTHPGRIRLAAAIAADNYKGAWASDIYDSGRKGYPLSDLSRATGAKFFRGGDDRARALEEDTTFNVGNSRTPILFTQHGYEREIDIGPDIFETIGAFIQARRPVEFAYLPEASHNLQRPRERAFMLGLTVDWLSFWLKGDEDPDPAKADQYKRWRALRAEWRQQQEWEAAGNPIGTKPRLDKLSPVQH
jgi:dipeptidyl aminopeptidase/acylaminoacyl peptidase